MRAVLVALVLIPIALAGCAGPPPVREIPKVYHTIPHALNVSVWEPCLGHVGMADLFGVGAKTSDESYLAFSAFDSAAHLTIPANVSSIVLDLWWDTGATTGIRAQAVGPDGQQTLSESHAATSDQDPIRLRFDHPAAGAWLWQGVADPVAAAVVLHYNEGLYYDTPESLAFQCNVARAANSG